MALADPKSETLSNVLRNLMDYIINKVGEQIIVSYNFIMHEFAYDEKRKFTQEGTLFLNNFSFQTAGSKSETVARRK